ncbi:LOW QUALITY PROTEIN: cell division control protein 45 homolog, partial [Daphnia carinata]|uniref:LOW QUALITY PROTEIN: cell division control protein 45 homolog n=1 Tax=Daphnia carinata TaxID=120202 RepID=UPI0025804F3C
PSWKEQQILFGHSFNSISYSIIPVENQSDLISAYKESCEQSNHIILINCGGTLDIVEHLEPSEEKVFFIADFHRPYDVCNIYNGGQVCLKACQKEILFNYVQFSFYSSSTGLMFELAWKLSRDSNDLLWWAIIGVGEQQLLGKVDSKTSVLDNGKLQSHMIRLAHLSQHGGDSTGTKDALQITHEKDLSLSMYRHWSLLESLKYTPQTASHFHLWTLKGEKKLNEFLADLGLLLSQCRQKYNSMDIELRNELRSIFQKKVEKYDLEDVIKYSFNSQYGFRPKNPASDLVFALLALLDSAERDKDPADAFHDALECLSNSKMDAVYRRIELAKLQQIAIGKEVHACLDMGHVINAGPCLYAVIQDVTRILRSRRCFQFSNNIDLSASRLERFWITSQQPVVLVIVTTIDLRSTSEK